MGGSSDVIEVAFGPGHKKRHVLCEPIEASKIDVSTVHHVERGWFEDQLIQEGNIVNFPMSDADYARDRASQIHLGMEFDGTLLLPKGGPRKKRQTQVDRGGIQSVSSLGDLQPEVLVCIQLSGHSDQHMSKVGVDAPIPFFVCIGQCASRNFGPDPCVIKLGLHGPQAYFDVAKTLPISQLSEGHAKELIETRKVPNPTLALVPVNASVEFVSREKAHELRENDSP
jgi:hypothetical protein